MPVPTNNDRRASETMNSIREKPRIFVSNSFRSDLMDKNYLPTEDVNS